MGGAGGRPHLTGAAGTSGMAGTTGTAGSGMTGTGGTGGTVNPQCVVPDGAVSWWHADGDFDDAVGSNDGSNAGGVSFGVGEELQAFNMIGTSGSFVDVPDSASLEMTAGITLDAWVNESILAGRIFDKITAFGADGFLLDMAGDRIRMIIGGDARVSDLSVPVGIWTHVAGTYDGSTISLYINGTPAGAVTVSPHPVPVNANTLKFGADSTGGSLYTGMIDEPRIFNRALTAAEIQTLFWQSTNCQ
jgi:hypothetical protein